MRNPVISPRFEESSYKGQDIVHEGVRIPLDMPPGEALKRFDKRAQEILKKPVAAVFRPAKDEDLAVLRQMWFDPNDATFPVSMDGHLGVVAVHDKGIVGGALWKQEGNNLFLHQLISGAKGRALGMPTRLIWDAVQRYHERFNALDIGVSYNPKRYAFFKHFAVETYPIILKKPYSVPVIRLEPFRRLPMLAQEKAPDRDYAGEKVTFLPRGAYALEAALRHVGVGEGDAVSIVKTFGSQYVSGCVQSIVGKLKASWSLRAIGAVKAVVAIHEFGIPVFQKQDMEVLEWARANNIPIIEDCAWRSTPVWEWSTYQVFSLLKTSTLNYGGFLRGVYIDDETLWSWGLLDAFKRDRLQWEEKQTMCEDKRTFNWMTYHRLVLEDGMTPDDCYDYEQAIKDQRWAPTVYLQRFKDDAEADAIVARLEEFGIQAGRYWGEPLVFLPVHQNMTREEVLYMFAVVRGYFNTCRDYHGSIKEDVHYGDEHAEGQS